MSSTQSKAQQANVGPQEAPENHHPDGTNMVDSHKMAVQGGYASTNDGHGATGEAQSKNPQTNAKPQEAHDKDHSEGAKEADGHEMPTAQYTSFSQGAPGTLDVAGAPGEAYVAPMMQRWLTEGRREQAWNNIGEVPSPAAAKRDT